MPEAIYLMCMATCLACVYLLWSGYRRTRLRLLCWGGWCFAFFTVNNALLLVEALMNPGIELSHLRTVMALIGVLLLLVALIWGKP